MSFAESRKPALLDQAQKALTGDTAAIGIISPVFTLGALTPHVLAATPVN